MHIIQVVACRQIENPIHALHPRNDVVRVSALADIGFKRVEFEQGECSSDQNHICGERCLVRVHSTLASRTEAGNALQKLIFDHYSGTSMENWMEPSKVIGQAECR